MRIKIWHYILVLLLVVSFVNNVSAQTTEDFDFFKKQVKEVSITNTTNLKLLFEIGDQKIDDLIKLLNDDDKTIRTNAQVLIRYLGNEKGMKVIHSRWTETKDEKILTLPIPTPLTEWDYDYIYSTLLNDPIVWNDYNKEYVLALALDSSLRAKAISKLIFKSASDNNIEDSIFYQSNYFLDKNLYIYRERNLVSDILDKVNLNESYNAKLISFNHAKSKAFLEISNDYARYHVIVNINNCCWRFSSIHLVSIS